jgi:hypothetical protein
MIGNIRRGYSVLERPEAFENAADGVARAGPGA